MTIPSETLTREEKVARSEEAKRLMEHPLLREAFANLRLNYFEAWCSIPSDKVNDRDAVFHAARVLADVESHLRVVISQGRLEKAHIDKMKAKAS
jgi:hypothetical protein